MLDEEGRLCVHPASDTSSLLGRHSPEVTTSAVMEGNANRADSALTSILECITTGSNSVSLLARQQPSGRPEEPTSKQTFSPAEL